jgi:hypothetical protein
VTPPPKPPLAHWLLAAAAVLSALGGVAAAALAYDPAAPVRGAEYGVLGMPLSAFLFVLLFCLEE